MQLNDLSRLRKFMGKTEKAAILNSFIYANFYYYFLVWHFCLCEPSRKIENIKKCCLKFQIDDYESGSEAPIRKTGTTTIKNIKATNFSD